MGKGFDAGARRAQRFAANGSLPQPQIPAVVMTLAGAAPAPPARFPVVMTPGASQIDSAIVASAASRTLRVVHAVPPEAMTYGRARAGSRMRPAR